MEIILGHMIGDYLLQLDWVAINKKKKGFKGLIVGIIHCIIWTISVYILGFLNIHSLIFFLMLLSLTLFLIERHL